VGPCRPEVDMANRTDAAGSLGQRIRGLRGEARREVIAEVVSRWRESGQSRAAFCREVGIATVTLTRWIRQLDASRAPCHSPPCSASRHSGKTVRDLVSPGEHLACQEHRRSWGPRLPECEPAPGSASLRRVPRSPFPVPRSLHPTARVMCTRHSAAPGSPRGAPVWRQPEPL